MTEVTGDARYAAAADAYVRATCQRAVKPNGLLGWGSHIYYHAYKDELGGDGNGKGPHEILIHAPDWERLYRVAPEAIRKEVDGIWEWHIVDKKTGLHNRHDDKHVACDFAFSGGSFALAFASMHAITGEAHYLDKARLVASWHWNARHKETGLAPDCPNLKSRYDGTHAFTTLPGPHASQLLRCYAVTRDKYFLQAAVGHIRAWDRYAWDENLRTFHGMLTLAGGPLPEQKRGAGYDIWKPTGLIDIWRTTMYSYEMPLIAAQATVYAYELSTDESDRAMLLRAARHWATAIEQELPLKSGRRWAKEIEATLPAVKWTGGTYAEDYGRSISFFNGLARITGEARYRRIAETIAQEALDKLYVNGLFRGHPAKNYYQSNDGVGFLLHGLLELDAAEQSWRIAF